MDDDDEQMYIFLSSSSFLTSVYAFNTHLFLARRWKTDKSPSPHPSLRRVYFRQAVDLVRASNLRLRALSLPSVRFEVPISLLVWRRTAIAPFGMLLRAYFVKTVGVQGVTGTMFPSDPSTVAIKAVRLLPEPLTGFISLTDLPAMGVPTPPLRRNSPLHSGAP